MEILNIQNHKRNYLPLLLLADEQEAMAAITDLINSGLGE